MYIAIFVIIILAIICIIEVNRNNRNNREQKLQVAVKQYDEVKQALKAQESELKKKESAYEESKRNLRIVVSNNDDK